MEMKGYKMDFKKIILMLSIISINILQSADSQCSYSWSGATLGCAKSTSSASAYSGEMELTTENTAKQESKEQQEELRMPNRCFATQSYDPKYKKEFEVNENEYQRLIACKNINPKTKIYLQKLHQNVNQKIGANIENAKKEAKNVHAVFNGQEAPLKTFLTLAIAKTMARKNKEILLQCNEKRKKELNWFNRILNLKTMVDKYIFPKIMYYCSNWYDVQMLDGNLTESISFNFKPLTKLTATSFASSSAYDGTIKIWKLQKGRYVFVQLLDRNVNGHTSIVNSLTKLSSTSFASGDFDGTIKIWQFDGRQYQCIQTIDRHVNGHHTERIASLTKLTATSFASGSWDKKIKIWQFDGHQYQFIQTLDQNNNGHTDIIESLTELTVTSFASGSYDQKIKIWELNEGQYVCTQTLDENSNGHKSIVESLTKLTATLFVSGSNDEKIKIWILHDGKYRCLQTLDKKANGHSSSIISLIKLTETSFVSSSDDQIIKIWQLFEDKFRCTQTLNLNDNKIASNLLTKLTKDKFASCSHVGIIKIWQLNTTNQENLLVEKIKIERGIENMQEFIDNSLGS